MMKPMRIMPLVIGIVVILSSAGCVSLTNSTDPSPKDLVIPLSKLTYAVQSEVAYPADEKPIPDKMLLNKAMEGKPELRKAFHGIPVMIRHSDKDVIVLICSPDGKYGWLEDSSKTPYVDRKWYEIDPSHSAMFTLDPSVTPPELPTKR